MERVFVEVFVPVGFVGRVGELEVRSECEWDDSLIVNADVVGRSEDECIFLSGKDFCIDIVDCDSVGDSRDEVAECRDDNADGTGGSVVAGARDADFGSGVAGDENRCGSVVGSDPDGFLTAVFIGCDDASVEVYLDGRLVGYGQAHLWICDVEVVAGFAEEVGNVCYLE